VQSKQTADRRECRNHQPTDRSVTCLILHLPGWPVSHQKEAIMSIRTTVKAGVGPFADVNG